MRKHSRNPIENHDGFTCRSRKCNRVATLVATENHRGFCSGVLDEPYKNTPKDDVISLCFVDKTGTTRYLLRPDEALSVATVLAHSFHDFVEHHRNLEASL